MGLLSNTACNALLFMDTRSAIREIKNAVLEQYQKGLPLETMVAEAQTRIEAKGVGVESARMLSLTVVPALCAAFEERAPSPGKRSSMIETLSAENVAGYAIGAGLLGGFIFAQWKWLGVGGGSLVGVVLAIGAGVL